MAPLMQSCHFFSRYGVTLSFIFLLAGLGAEIFSLNIVRECELNETWEISLVNILAMVLFEPAATGTGIYFIASRSNGKSLSVYDCFMKSWGPYSRLVICYFLVTGIVIFGFALYLLPSIYFFYKLIFAEYQVVLEEKAPSEALIASFSQTNGQAQLILPSFVVIFVMLLGGGWLIDNLVRGLGEGDAVRILSAVAKAPLLAFTTLVGFRLYNLAQSSTLKTGV